MPTSSRRYQVSLSSVPERIRTGEQTPRQSTVYGGMVRRPTPQGGCTMVRCAGRCGHRPLQGAFVLVSCHMVPAVHPRRGRRRGPWPLAGDCAICGWRFGRLGDFARCGGRVFRAVRGATGGTAPWTPRFWATRRPLYWMYGKKPHRGYGGKGPASTADTRAVGGPHRKKSSKTFIFAIAEICSCPHGRWMV